MAVPISEQQLNMTVKSEAASTTIFLNRNVINLEEGGIRILYDMHMSYDIKSYQIDENGKRVKLLDPPTPGESFCLSEATLFDFFSEQITLRDGTVTCLGALICARGDEILHNHLTSIENGEQVV